MNMYYMYLYVMYVYVYICNCGEYVVTVLRSSNNSSTTPIINSTTSTTWYHGMVPRNVQRATIYILESIHCLGLVKKKAFYSFLGAWTD